MKPLSDTELKQILNDARLEINFRGYKSSEEEICAVFIRLFEKLSGKSQRVDHIVEVNKKVRM